MPNGTKTATKVHSGQSSHGGSPDAGLRPAPAKAQLSKEDACWQLVQRIAGSRSLGRSTLLADFLLYICDRQLRGKDHEITEQRIGVIVFGRPEGYNSNEDNIVRNYARTLRKRIEEYFETEGLKETLRLEIPRGGYVPVFLNGISANAAGTINVVDRKEVDVPQPSPLPDLAPPHNPARNEATASSPQPPSFAIGWLRVRWNVKMLSSAALGLTLVSGILIGRSLSRSSAFPRLQTSVLASTDDSRNSVFWSHIFQQRQDTYIVPADGGLVMLQSFTRHPVSLAEYAKGNYRGQTQIAQDIEPILDRLDGPTRELVTHRIEVIGARRYTSMVDLDLASQISRLPQVVSERLMVRYARDLRIDDLRSGNAILLGSSDANPWTELFQGQLNFRFDAGVDGGSQRIVNQHPLPGEKPVYLSDGNDPQHRTYGVIAFLPNLNSTGYVLIIEGVNMAGTQAAGDFLLSPALLRPVLQKVVAANGAIRPFELLVTTNDVAANASRPQVLSERIGEN